MRLLLLAAPGGGKGTQGEALASLYGIQHISSGDVLRAEAHAGTPVGREIADFLVEVNGDQSPEGITAEIQARLAGR